MKLHFYHEHLEKAVRRVVGHCDACQRYKDGGRQYGELPPRDVLIAPWQEVHLDLIGPWKITVHGMDLHFRALTAIDPVTNLMEIYRLQEKSAYYVGQQFENGWLSRYPRPMRCIHDQGPEFKGEAFQQVLTNNNIEDVPTTVKNPQSNAICERVHQTIGNILRTMARTNPPQDILAASDLMDSCLATAMLATRAAASRALDYVSPGALVFQRDMFLDVPLIADIMALGARRQVIVNESLRRANLRRRTYDYKVNDQILVKVPDPGKLDPRFEGPYRINAVHVNGTVTIQRAPNIIERINIRRIKPYRSPDH